MSLVTSRRPYRARRAALLRRALTAAAVASLCLACTAPGVLTAGQGSSPTRSATPAKLPVKPPAKPLKPATPVTTPTPTPTSTPAPTAGQPVWGVYTFPGANGVAGDAAFARSTGLPITEALDFGPPDTWKSMTQIDWLLSAYTGKNLRLEYSLPMLPNEAGVSLAACASGTYNPYWTLIGQAMVKAKLPTTIVRPGWEMNGDWYRWSAASSPTTYAGCYRQIVTTMRAVTGSHFSFDFNANLGPGKFPAELAYPGDAYVDEVSVDIYDTTWTWYPPPYGVTGDQAKANAWNYLERGNHGLNFWVAYALSHGKPFGITEWASTWFADGHAGGDNPYFIDKMLDYIADPAHHVARSYYFNSGNTAGVSHDIVSPTTKFPKAAAELRRRALLL